jgi:hypothetical protein
MGQPQDTCGQGRVKAFGVTFPVPTGAPKTVSTTTEERCLCQVRVTIRRRDSGLFSSARHVDLNECRTTLLPRHVSVTAMSASLALKVRAAAGAGVSSSFLECSELRGSDEPSVPLMERELEAIMSTQDLGSLGERGNVRFPFSWRKTFGYAANCAI